MNAQLKQEIELRRQKLAIKSMYFNRFLLVRYMTAFLFFLFLNWVLAMILVNSVFMIVPILFFIMISIASFEQIKLYSQPKDNANLSISSYKILLVSLCILFISLFTPLYSELFPFLTSTLATKQAVVFLIGLAILFSLIVLKRLNKIKYRQDKQFQRILAMQAVLN